MFNPLAPWTGEALKGLTAEGHRFFVRQTFNRAKGPFDKDIKGYFLFCHYKEAAPAKEHYDALKDDPNRFLYDWAHEDHRRKLELAASQPAGFKLYTNTFLPDWERQITKRIRQNIRLFIQEKGWHPGREEGVGISFYPHFGEVMIILKFRAQEVRVPFFEIENLR